MKRHHVVCAARDSVIRSNEFTSEFFGFNRLTGGGMQTFDPEREFSPLR